MVHSLGIQSIGLVALLVNLSIFQTNNRKNMLLLGLSGCLLWSAHFYLLGAMAAVAMNTMAAIRFCVYYNIKPSRRNIWIMWLFIALTAAAIIPIWKGPVSLLPFLGTLCGVIGFWQKKTKYIRRLALLSSPPWFIYALIVGSYPGMMAETLLMTSNLIGQYRFDFRTVFRSKLRAAKLAAKS